FDGKTSRRTGRKRVIHLQPEALEICRQLAAEHPDGPIFRNEDGAPWTKDAINCQIRRLRKRAGLGRDVFAYAFRHLFVTDALERSVPVATVAELAGHLGTA